MRKPTCRRGALGRCARPAADAASDLPGFRRCHRQGDAAGWVSFCAGSRWMAAPRASRRAHATPASSLGAVEIAGWWCCTASTSGCGGASATAPGRRLSTSATPSPRRGTRSRGHNGRIHEECRACACLRPRPTSSTRWGGVAGFSGRTRLAKPEPQRVPRLILRGGPLPADEPTASFLNRGLHAPGTVFVASARKRLREIWSGRVDSNHRPPGPEPDSGAC
jgi:hypothetical protein